MSMTEFRGQDLTGACFERVNLPGATFTQVFLNDASMHAVDITGGADPQRLFSKNRMHGVGLARGENSPSRNVSASSSTGNGSTGSLPDVI
jgi:uncharacterized protein YjbI with pentapeptide repeats